LVKIDADVVANIHEDTFVDKSLDIVADIFVAVRV